MAGLRPLPDRRRRDGTGRTSGRDILAGNRVTRCPYRLIRNNQSAAKRDHRTDDVMRPPHDCSPFWVISAILHVDRSEAQNVTLSPLPRNAWLPFAAVDSWGNSDRRPCP